MPKVIKSAGREIVLKVKRSCEAERDNKGPIIPFCKVRARTAFLTGISERTVTQITRESNLAEASNSKIVTPGKNRDRKSFLEIDDFDKCAIRHMIHTFYVVKKEIPTIHKLWLALKSDIDFKYSKTTLRRVLRSMGYKYKKCQSKRKLLMERYDIAAWRAKFILRMRKNRLEEKRPVIYLDETYIHASYHLQKCWQSNEEPGVLTSDSAGTRWIIAHAGGKTGFVENGLLLFKSQSKSSDYHDDMNAKNFIKWMTEKIIPNLPLNCIVVMDNASYHCTQLNKAPTMSNLKAEMQEWLLNNSIPFEDYWTKPQLYLLIKKTKGDPVYEVEHLLNQHGHEVVQLPPYHCDLNPIEKIWALVKRRIAEKNVSQTTSEISSITEAAFNTVTTMEWINVCQHVEKIEDKYFESDRLMDIELDKFIIDPTSDDESLDSSDDEMSEDSESNIMEGINPLEDHNYTKFISTARYSINDFEKYLMLFFFSIKTLDEKHIILQYLYLYVLVGYFSIFYLILYYVYFRTILDYNLYKFFICSSF
ncbi:uncharacterized protein LOC135078286 [Ostrinia nubilalis]|uniref:uncharacterized protein LOC135078286 n=1 Tax=Ostrinia nubilalis TaxID=29057 RepID=UPI0030823935